MTDLDAAGLEARLKIVEDKLAIYELIASHPPSADTGSADYTSSVYLEDGVFDRGPTMKSYNDDLAIADPLAKSDPSKACEML